MLRLIRFELYKMSRRPRSYIGFAAFFVINILVMLGLKYGDMGDMVNLRTARQGFDIVGSPANGSFLSWLVIGSPISAPILVMFTPFFVSLIFGEIMSGESADGTLRTALTRPIRRLNLFFSKFAASLIYTSCLMLFLGLSAYLLGLFAFGRGGLMSTGTFQRPMLTWFSEGEGMLRLALAYGLSIIGMVAVGMMAFFISCWLDNSLGAIGGAIGVLFTMGIIGEIPYFSSVKDYLISTNLIVGQNAFLDPIPWNEIRFSVVCLSIYIAVFFAISLFIFRRKDILT